MIIDTRTPECYIVIMIVNNNSNQQYMQDEISKLIKSTISNTAHAAYLQCLALECGEGKCAKAIKSKFLLEGITI